MTHPDKNQNEITRATARPTSMAIAMSLPEILSNILSFVDHRSLAACLQVSLSRPRQPDGNDKKNDNANLNAETSDHVNNSNNNSFNVQDFLDNCHRIQSFTISDPDTDILDVALERMRSSLDSKGPISLEAPGLTNLEHFAIISPVIEALSINFENMQKVYEVAGSILSQNPGVRKLVLSTFTDWDQEESVIALLKRASRHLKRLTVLGSFASKEPRFLEYLIEANERRLVREQRDQRQKQLLASQDRESSTDGQALDDENKEDGGPIAGDDSFDGACELEELMLVDLAESNFNGFFHPEICFEWLHYVPGTLPIRTLIMVDLKICASVSADDEPFDQYDSDSWSQGSQGSQEHDDDSLLAILSKCPDLQKLEVTYRRGCHLVETAPHPFRDGLETSPFYVESDDFHEVKMERERFVTLMHRYCPKIREIEFGMAYRFTPQHWVDMMRKYGPQLESLSVWGNVRSFCYEAFLTLIGPPASHPSRKSPHCLTRLNINGLEHLHHCAWMALKHLPNLKEFRARDVALDARELVMEDGWACKGLEVLEIFIAVPKNTQWAWSEFTARWERDAVLHNKTSTIDKASNSLNMAKDNDSRDQCRGRKSIKRQRDELITEGPVKRAKQRKEDTEEAGKVAGRRGETDTNKKTRSSHEGGLDASELSRRKINIEVCTILGSLTKLRRLRIEGQANIELAHKVWGCLDLTVDTGLDCLAPLRENLETLNVAMLATEGLTGRREVEWIARNWVHYNNHHWLEEHSSKKVLRSSQRLGKDRPARSEGDIARFVPSPRFKELIGLNIPWETKKKNEALSNIEWLQEQCPTLIVLNAGGRK
ncbi:hypothetical protein BGX31_007082 [Mortierella sp. GBA43]|nr:hypothetical protein BGX31_007082 [Mortierella sp. GBA43]